ncbi:Tetratricopeptide repeat protein [Anatilimnocola aggregata]|uniref:Tetratricopeptide repeat protein n=1 Tax=Anatilimnocola aggregata TaxID=2528021 RepID=A0A517YBJ5_9BACT|nr:tetratricopeptide repeat protein [Anatilimnocola aggregata]QDU27617.1 Tetratricopeptide repeat protein [Anatilimnocola aggregata]
MRRAMRKIFLLFALLLGVTLLQTFAAAQAQAGHGHYKGWGHNWGWGRGWGHHGWNRGWGYGHNRFYGGWGGYGWGHRNWGWGRGYVYRPFYRPVYNVGYRSFGYGGFYPAVNYGYYPSYGFPVYNSYYYGCENVVPATTIEQPYYDTQILPTGTIVNYSGNNGGLSTELTTGMLIARLADAVRQQPGGMTNGNVASNGRLLGNGRLRGVVQNITQNVIRNEPLSSTLPTTTRFSNPDSRSKARAYMTQGDNLFREQRYAAAAQQYRAAASLTPDLPEANWRYGHTLVAMGEYDLAASAMRRALAIADDTDRNGFELDSLYGLVGTAKASHLEGLAKAALEQELPSAYYLLGVTLHYSGEADRAEKFFAHAAQLQGRDAPHIVAFLGPEVGPLRPRQSDVPPLLARLPMREI